MYLLIRSSIYEYPCLYYTVPGPVLLLSATPLLTALQVTWLPPSVPNGVIITYEVVYEGPQESGTVNTTELSFALNNLGPNSSYTFTVSGYTLAGRGANVTVYSTPIEHSKLYHPCNSTEVLETVPYNTFHVYSLYSIIQFHQNVIKLGHALRPNLICT